jgi:hypothetical protein
MVICSQTIESSAVAAANASACLGGEARATFLLPNRLGGGPLPRRRSLSDFPAPPLPQRRSPSPFPAPPSPRRRSPSDLVPSPSLRRRSPSHLLPSPSPRRRSPSHFVPRRHQNGRAIEVAEGGGEAGERRTAHKCPEPLQRLGDEVADRVDVATAEGANRTREQRPAGRVGERR